MKRSSKYPPQMEHFVPALRLRRVPAGEGPLRRLHLPELLVPACRIPRANGDHRVSQFTLADERVLELLSWALASGSDESWEPLRRFGFTRTTQCHHSEHRKVVVGDREYPFG